MRLFIHSWRQVVGNFAQALRVGKLLLALTLASPLLMLLGLGGAVQGLLFIASIALSITTAIAWHRFVLLADPDAADPLNPPPGSFQAYFLTGLRVALLLFVAVLLASTFASLVAGLVFGASFMVELPDGTIAPGPAYLPILLFIAVVMNTMFNRFALCFPAIAVGRRIGLRESWERTAPMNGQIIVTSVLMIAAIAALQAIALGLPSNSAGGALLGIVIAVPIWIFTMLGISVMTTLYGHLVEGRALNA
ncbi:hypothetical protein LGT41_0000980 [Abyssibius alkaniclasticus]|uniref:hypothetical protein n=1 Tax=Abyssibius alkaniclasticus TaxID=2881234 RepID=UPI00236495E6|nr:hypothetical protein [Abyssibius alkaniclasticus]UPH71419.1 hypothetical protein LGT41_0000980 [Abyssibius alkaniclasticus]|tara:strand:- start:156 stop:905 length:750 start_codon:yes stop_codon:yes gene_type:complete